jgi:hypothetical protein
VKLLQVNLPADSLQLLFPDARHTTTTAGIDLPPRQESDEAAGTAPNQQAPAPSHGEKGEGEDDRRQFQSAVEDDIREEKAAASPAGEGRKSIGSPGASPRLNQSDGAEGASPRLEKAAAANPQEGSPAEASPAANPQEGAGASNEV